MKNFLHIAVALCATLVGFAASAQSCIEAECDIIGYGSTARSLWITNLPSGIDKNFAFDQNGGTFTRLPNGQARLTGNCFNINNPSYGFAVDFRFSEKRNWEAWSGLGRSWKGDPDIVGDLYETWEYYIMDPSYSNVLTGLGNFAGSVLNCNHNPEDYYFGLQVGLAANDKNGELGMSVWFNYNGVINGESRSGTGDFNLEGGCEDVPIIDCPVDVTVECTENGYLPDFTGWPMIPCLEEYTLNYTDETSGGACNFVITRTFTVTLSNGDSMSCQQSISVSDTTAPSIGTVAGVMDACDFENIVTSSLSDNCDPSPQVEIEVISVEAIADEDCDPGQLRTQTIGGWGAAASGNNSGVYRDANFAAAFPNGLSIGCTNTLILTSSQAVQDFLPAGDQSAILPAGSLINPNGNYSNTFASQLVGITLSLGFDAYDPNFGASDFALADVVYQSGTFAGMTLQEVVNIANEVIGGCSTAFSISALNQALTQANENYVDGTQNNGAFGCNPNIDCGAAAVMLITASDACGNTSSVESTVYFSNVLEGLTLNFPSDITVSCGEVPAIEDQFTGTCFDAWLQVDVQETNFSGACQPTIQRIYTISDFCGNTVQHTQYITVIDNTPPVFVNAPADLQLSCEDEIPDFEPQVSDACGVFSLSVHETTQANSCGFVLIRTWTALDFCGNFATITQHILVTDHEGPVVVTAVEDLTASCTSIPLASQVSFSDACDAAVSITFSEQQQGSGCSFQIIRQWIATDACGNSTLVNQIIYVVDNTAPEFVFIPSDAVVNCSNSNAQLSAQAIAIDACSNVSVTLSETITSADDACLVLLRIWTAIDACGNTAIATQTITFADEEAPVLSGVPQAYSNNCSALVSIPNVSAFDACDGPVDVVFSENVSNTNCTIVVVRTWEAIDQCGNTATATQTIQFNDTQAPAITGQSQISAECAEVDGVVAVDVSDDCVAGVELTYIDEITENAASCTYEIVRTYTAIDLCGNMATFVQSIQVIDQTPPVFTYVPANLTLGCQANAVFESPVVYDVCSAVNLTVNEAYSGDGCHLILTRTFTASDNCGNIAVASQTIAFIDDTAPAFTFVPQNQTIGCGEALPLVQNAQAIDDCGNTTLSFDEFEILGACGLPTTVRRWTAVDDCGNSATAEQLIQRIDQTVPTFNNLPTDQTVSCGAIPPPANVTASDNCSAVTVSFNESTDSGGCPNIYRTWIATDACGNTALFIQTLFVDDNEPPMLTGIAPLVNATCNALPPAPEPQVSDNCDDNVDVALIETVVGEGCTFTIIRTWIASDDCGNTSVVSQSVIVEDTEAPVFVNVPAEQTVECSALAGLNFPQVTDDCGNTISVVFEDQALGAGCSYDILRTYTATDLCGNSTSATTLIHVIDTTPPAIFGVAGNTAVQCGSIPATNAAHAIDACGGQVPLVVTDQIMGEGCSYIISRTYTAQDACGNTAALTQLIFVSDQAAPVLLGVPQNVTIDCNAAIPPAPVVGAIDACEGVRPVQLSQFTEFTGCSQIITRIWSASDACGNQVTAVRTVTITDLSAPQFIAPPSDLYTDCNNIPAVHMPQAFDACSNVSVSVDETVIAGGCPYEIQRVFKVTDGCGNSATHVQRIFVSDDQSPELLGDFSDLTVGCGQVPAPLIPLASDNCGQPEVFFNETYGAPGCVQLLVRTWTAVDLCGNTATQTQFIHIVDDAAPAFAITPADLTTNCLMVPAFVNITATDACGWVEQQMEEFTYETACGSEYTLVRVWSALDQCGNESVHVQTITVIDDIAPLLVNAPADLTVDCGEVPEPAAVGVIESCGESTSITFEEVVVNTGGNENSCTVANAAGFTGDIALWLPGVDGIGANYVYGAEGGVFTVDEANGKAYLTGIVYNTENASMSWSINLVLHEARNWEQWAALGRDYKDDLGIATAHYQNWTYYVLDAESTSLTGLDAFEGSTLSLTHAPADTTFGFQLGMNANNHSEGFGLGGWFFYAGQINGAPVSGHGDFFTTQSCCAEEHIIRTWTATDCAGNTTTHVQNIFVVPGYSNEAQALVFDEPKPWDFDVRGTTAEEFMISFDADFNGNARIELFDSFGKRIDIVKEWMVIEGASYSIRHPKANLAPGMYYFMIFGDQRIATDSELVIW